MHVNRNTPTPARWRVACVDGILHVAYKAAVAAESAAHRCAEHVQPSSRRRGWLHPHVRNHRKHRRPLGARPGPRARRRHAR